MSGLDCGKTSEHNGNEKYEEFEIEEISGGKNPLKLFISKEHRFGTDAVLLAEFAAPKRNDTVCDLCTGCGIIPALLYQRYSPAKIYAADIAKEAVDMLKRSVSINRLENIIFPVNEDLKNLTIPRENMDMVTVNPPYFKKNSGEEKKAATKANARHENLCDIDDVCMAAARLLKYGGTLKMCHIPTRLSDVICAMRGRGIEPKKLVFVSSGKNKPWLFLISGKKGGKAGMEVSCITK